MGFVKLPFKKSCPNIHISTIQDNCTLRGIKQIKCNKTSLIHISFLYAFLQPCPATVTSSSLSSPWSCRRLWGQIPTRGKNMECRCKILYWNDKIFTLMIAGDFCTRLSTGLATCTVIISSQPLRANNFNLPGPTLKNVNVTSRRGVVAAFGYDWSANKSWLDNPISLPPYLCLSWSQDPPKYFQ